MAANTCKRGGIEAVIILGTDDSESKSLEESSTLLSLSPVKPSSETDSDDLDLSLHALEEFSGGDSLY